MVVQFHGAAGFDRRRRLIIGKLQLHGFEAGRGGRAEAFEQRMLGEKVGEIGGEARHGSISRAFELAGALADGL